MGPEGLRTKDGVYLPGAGLGSQRLRMGDSGVLRAKTWGSLGLCVGVLGTWMLVSKALGLGRPVDYDQRICGPGWWGLSNWY